ncbi:MAG TPA: condensation domain-containing protein, partial [Ktedonobacteraceae bacterium]
MIPHDALLNFVDTVCTLFEVGPDDGVLQFASVSFDTSMEEIYPCLVSGARLVLRTENMIETATDFLRASFAWGTTIQSLPTAYWHELTRSIVEESLVVPNVVRLISIGGEQMSSAVLASWYRHVKAGPILFNSYGPTESTVVATYQRLSATATQSRSVSIGQPIAHVAAYVFDTELQPVPVGQAGELYLAGRGLARGYLGRPEITADRFLPWSDSPEPGMRLYRTGDLVRAYSDGHLEFLGRADQQVKIRGYRVEPGEIEALLCQHPGIEEAFVVAREASRAADQASQLHLIAYLRTSVRQEPERGDLRRFLKGSLPEYMVPNAFLFVETFPVNQNGKVNRQALPAPDWAQMALDDAFMVSRTPAEAVLADIWAEVLGLPAVSANANFFELGGHSLAAMRVLTAIRRTFQLDVSFQHFFAMPTIAEMASYLTTGKQDATALLPMTHLPRTGVFPLSYSQERVWFLHQLDPDILAYHVQTAHILAGRLDVASLERSINELISRHEILRTTFPTIDGTPVQEIHAPRPVFFPVIDLQGLDPVQRKATTQLLTAQALRLTFNLSRLPLLRWILLRQESQQHVLLLIEHHLIHDGWSYNLLLTELLALYQAFSTGQPSSLAELPVQFADFAVWQRKWMQGGVREKQLQYWRKQLEHCSSELNLPYDHPRPAVQSFTGQAIAFQLAPEISASLRILSRREGTTLFMTMLAAFTILLARYSEQEDICVGTSVANRRLLESESLLGMIVNNVVLRTKISLLTSFRSVLKQVRQVLLEAYENQDVPFDQVVQAVQP